MKCLQRNKREFWYAPYLRTDEVKDEYGNVTSYEPVYAPPIKSRANWSATRGQMEIELFGNSEQYDRIVIADESMPGMTEETILWFGKSPEDGAHNYIVMAVADSLNGCAYAVRQVNVNA